MAADESKTARDARIAAQALARLAAALAARQAAEADGLRPVKVHRGAFGRRVERGFRPAPRTRVCARVVFGDRRKP
jgi:hypothetical protein